MAYFGDAPAPPVLIGQWRFPLRSTVSEILSVMRFRYCLHKNFYSDFTFGGPSPLTDSLVATVCAVSPIFVSHTAKRDSTIFTVPHCCRTHFRFSNSLLLTTEYKLLLFHACVVFSVMWSVNEYLKYCALCWRLAFITTDRIFEFNLRLYLY